MLSANKYGNISKNGKIKSKNLIIIEERKKYLQLKIIKEKKDKKNII